MEIRLLSDTEDHLIFSNEPSTGLQIVLPQSITSSVSGDFGELLLERLPAGRFDIFYSQYQINRDCSFYLATDEPSLELHFMESNSIAFKLSELGTVEAGEREYNITYLPYIESVTELRPGNYSSFDIHFPVKFLIELASNHPLVDAFLKQIDHNTAHQYSSGRHRASTIMQDIIRDLRINPFRDTMLSLYLDSKCLELLLLSLQSLSMQVEGRIRFRQDDIEKMHEAERIILSNLHNPYSLIELAHKVGVNDFKLKKLFPRIYGMTVFSYIMKAKMDKARRLILDTDLPFGEIALETGFKNASNFNTAFRRAFKCTPTDMRKHRK